MTLEESQNLLAIFFVLIFQYFWTYQKPSVSTVEVRACKSPKVRVLEEAKFKFIILTDRDKSPCCVQALK